MTETQTPAPDTTTPAQTSVVVPDKPALEGLEQKWAARWKVEDTYAFDRTQPRENVYSHRHATPDGERQPARRARLLLHPHRPDRPLPADARQVGLLPHGLGRQRAADRAPGAELLRRALRPVAALRRRLHPAGEARPQASGADQPAQLHRPVRAARRAGRAGLRVRCGARSASPSTGRQHYTTIGTPPGSRVTSARSCATSPAARPTSRRRRPSGTSPSRPPSRRPSSRRRSTTATTTGSPSTAPTAAVATIETTRPELIPERGRADRAPGRRALPAACSASTVSSPVFGVDIPVLAHPAAEMDKGCRPRHVLHLR